MTVLVLDSGVIVNGLLLNHFRQKHVESLTNIEQAGCH